MKSQVILILFVSLGIITVGCGNEKKASNSVDELVFEKIVEPIDKSSSSEYFIQNTNQEILSAFSINNGVIEIRANGSTFTSKLKDDKRKYYKQGNSHIYSIKYSDDAFKLRNSSEEFLLKVKLYDGYLKVSKDEEMTDYYKIALNDGKLKLKKDDEELESIVLPEETNNSVAINDYNTTGFSGSMANGVLLIDDIPFDQKVILMAEIIAANK